MSTPKKYLCNDCPGSKSSGTIPCMRDIPGERLNQTIYGLKRSSNERNQQIGEAACELIQAERCEGPLEQVAHGDDSEGTYVLKGETDLICGRGQAKIKEITDVVLRVVTPEI